MKIWHGNTDIHDATGPVFNPCIDTLSYAPNEKDCEERGTTEKRRLDRRVANQGSNLGCLTADTQTMMEDIRYPIWV